MVSNEDKDSLKIASDAKVYSSFLQKGKGVGYKFKEGYGGYLYLLEGGPISIGGKALCHLDAAMIKQEKECIIEAEEESELLFVVIAMNPEKRRE